MESSEARPGGRGLSRRPGGRALSGGVGRGEGHTRLLLHQAGVLRDVPQTKLKGAGEQTKKLVNKGIEKEKEETSLNKKHLAFEEGASVVTLQQLVSHKGKDKECTDSNK